MVHSFLGWLGFYNDRVGRWIKGEKSLLYSQGRERVEEMKTCQISRKDLLEAIRRELHQTELENVEEIYMERSGELSVIKKNAANRPDGYNKFPIELICMVK
ncbi:MAG: DUF421 domain-containing protein [Bacteroidetes bacterium]|nr:DUF421 domain-containing protein [Bacteroidota bacterium]